MATNVEGEGDQFAITAPTGGARRNKIVVVGSLYGVALHDAAAGQPVVIKTSGRFRLEKANVAFSTGTQVYWDATNGVATTTATGNTLIGQAVEPAATGDSTVHVFIR